MKTSSLIKRSGLKKLPIPFCCAVAILFSITAQGQLRKPILKNRRQIENKILYKKGSSQIVLDSTQFKYHNAYEVASYFSKFYLSAIDLAPSYILDGTNPDTKIKYTLYNTNGTLLTSYVSTNSNPWPTDPYNNHPVGEVELPIHGGHKLVELMNKPCVLKITMLPIDEDTVKIARFLLLFKYAQNYYPDNPEKHEPEYSNMYGIAYTQWFRSPEDTILTLTKEHPTVSLQFQYNHNLVSTYSNDRNTVFVPIY